MNLKHPWRADFTNPRVNPRNNGHDSHKASVITMACGHGDHSTTSSSFPTSLWSRVTCELASWRRGTVFAHEVDSWLRFNPYIRCGYRHRLLRKREALGSMILYLHNETFNALSHLAMAIFMVLVLLLCPPWALVIGGGHGVRDLSSSAGAGAGTHVSKHPASAPLGPCPREPMALPPWLRGLQRIAAVYGTTAADGRGDSVRGYVPPCDAATSPHALGGVAEGTTAYPSASLSLTHLPSVLSPSPPPAPMTVAARLSLSLTPLLAAFLLTFSLSVVYHVFMPCCRSRRGYQQLLQCDVTGVILSISGSAYAYFTCGMPCVSESLQVCAGALMMASTLLCIYVLVLAPMRTGWAEMFAAALRLLRWIAAVVSAAVLEFLMGRPLGALQPSSESQLRSHILFLVSAWLQRHRRISSATLRGTSTMSAKVGHAEVGPVQRAVVLGGYCLLHLFVYVALVYPKSEPSMGGFTQATYHHSASYMWLFLGGLVNASRFPEAVVFRWTRRAARHSRHMATAETAAWHAERLRVGAAMTEMDAPKAAAGGCGAASSSSSGAGRLHPASSVGAVPGMASSATCVLALPSSPATPPTWWEFLRVPELLATSMDCAAALDYIGNSHNLWHVCTAMSAVSSLLAVYYDCIEYDLVQCSG